MRAPVARPQIPGEERDFERENRDGAQLADAPESPSRGFPGAVVASRITLLFVGAGAELAAQTSLAHDQHAVGQRQHFRQVARHQQDRACPARPARGRCRGSRISRATSTPLVGSSSSSTRGASASHLATTIFCWLPPLSLSGVIAVDGVAIRHVADERRRSPRSPIHGSAASREWRQPAGPGCGGATG